jgi:hypothetical protein
MHLDARCYTCCVPTTRKRYTVTETDEIARAIEEAARTWPDEHGQRGHLLLRLVEKGYQALRAEREDAAASRREAIARTSGALTGVYEDGYLEHLREDWPE